MTTFPHTEKQISQISALQLLINLGYTYLNPEQAFGKEGRESAGGREKSKNNDNQNKEGEGYEN